VNKFYGTQAGAVIAWESKKNYQPYYYDNICQICKKARGKGHPKCSREMQRRRQAEDAKQHRGKDDKNTH